MHDYGLFWTTIGLSVATAGCAALIRITWETETNRITKILDIIGFSIMGLFSIALMLFTVYLYAFNYIK